MDGYASDYRQANQGRSSSVSVTAIAVIDF